MRFKHLFFYLCLSSILIQCDSSESKSDLANFKDYIYSHTQGEISIADPIVIRLVKPVENLKVNQELSTEILDFKPKVEGKLWLTTDRNLMFKPSENLESGQIYQGQLHLDQLYKDIESDFSTYSFEVATIKPDFKVSLDQLEFYTQDWAYRYANVETSDIMSLEDIKKVVSAEQNQKSLPLDWSENTENSTYFKFKIDSIKRFDQTSSVELSWDGDAIQASNKGKNTFVAT
jgi:hypothetical protein